MKNVLFNSNQFFKIVNLSKFMSIFFSAFFQKLQQINLRVLLLSKLKKRQYLNNQKKNYFIYNYNFFHTLLTMF